MPTDLERRLLTLAKTRDTAEARQTVKKLEAADGFTWRAVGDRESNFGNINIGSDPGHAFVERVTNAIDAVIEREAMRSLRRVP